MGALLITSTVRPGSPPPVFAFRDPDGDGLELIRAAGPIGMTRGTEEIR